MKWHWIYRNKLAPTLLVNSAEREKPAFGVTDIQSTAIVAYLYSHNKNVGVDTQHLHWIPYKSVLTLAIEVGRTHGENLSFMLHVTPATFHDSRQTENT